MALYQACPPTGSRKRRLSIEWDEFTGSGRQLLCKFGRCKNDPDILCELIVVGFIPAEKGLYRFWSKLCALAFGVGVVTGLVMSYETFGFFLWGKPV